MDACLDFPAARNNREPILEVLRDVLPASGRVLEIGSGSGQHVCHFAAALPGLTWLPSDPEPAHRASIAGWAAETGAGVAGPLDLDAAADAWRVEPVDAILNVNMIHVAPWPATRGLMRNASAVLKEGGLLYLYGPFSFGGKHIAESNIRFDASLRAQNADWGVRDLDDVSLEARANELHLVKTVRMPVNNVSVLFKKRAGLR